MASVRAPLLQQEQPSSSKPDSVVSALPPCPARVDNAAVDAMIEDLQGLKAEWAALPLSHKIQLLKAVRSRSKDFATSFARAGASVRGLEGSPSDVTLELVINHFMIGNFINKQVEVLSALASTGSLPAQPTRQLPGGQLAVKVFPMHWRDKVNPLAMGMSAELYLQPGAAPTHGGTLKATAGGEVAVVLMPGNYGALGLRDLLTIMFEYNAVAVLKFHPMWENETYARIVQYILEPLQPYCRCVFADNATTAHLVRHPRVDHAHMTGGTPTHDILAWGDSPQERERRKAANDPLVKGLFTSELGCVSPMLVAPGKWTSSELSYYANAVVESAFNNISCNCNSVKVVVLPGDWEQGDELIRNIKETTKQMRLKPAFYPGIRDRYNKWKQHYPNAEAVYTEPLVPNSETLQGDPLPWLVNVMEQLPANPKSEYAFQVEPFAPVLTIVKLPTKGVEEFLTQAVALANDSLWGTLSANLLVDSRTEQQHKDAVERAVQDLRYGCVSVNNWSALVYAVTPATWGAYGGAQTIHDIGSGSGAFGNPLMYDRVQKSVLRTPWNSITTVQPSFAKPLPLLLARALCGALCDGIWGLLYALFWSK